MNFKVKKQKKGHLVKEGQQYILYHLNKHYMENPEAKVVFLFDFVDAGVSNLVSRKWERERERGNKEILKLVDNRK